MYGISFFEFLELAGFLVLIFTAVSYEVAVLPLIVIAGSIVLTYFLNGFDPFSLLNWIGSHQFTFIFAIVGYIVFGIGWSFFKWRDKLKELSRVAVDLLATKPNDFATAFKRKTWYDYPVRARTSKNNIVTWMMYWPVSMIMWVFGDWFLRLWNNIYEKLHHVYQAMADKEFSSVDTQVAAHEAERLAEIEKLRRR